MVSNLDNVVIMFLPIVGTVSLFAVVAVAIWASQRRRERELHYRHELLKKLVDKGADKAELNALIQADSTTRWATRLEGMKVGGLVVFAAGIGTMIGLRFIDDEAIWMVGAIPALIGCALLFYAFVLAPKPPSS